MSEKKTGPVFEIRPGIIPEAHSTIKNVEAISVKEMRLYEEGIATKDDEMYGHAARSLVQTMYGNASRTPDEQRSILRAKAERLIKRYGERVKGVISPELLEALGIKND